jgi:hypothetical protein
LRKDAYFFFFFEPLRIFFGKRLDLPLFELIFPFLSVFTCVLSFMGHPVLLLPQEETNRETTNSEAIRSISFGLFMFFFERKRKKLYKNVNLARFLRKSNLRNYYGVFIQKNA